MPTAPERLYQVADELHQLTFGLRDTGILLALIALEEKLRGIASELEAIRHGGDT